MVGTTCDETFWSWRSRSGVLRSPTNTLIYKQGALTTAPEAPGPAEGALLAAARAVAYQQAADPAWAAALPSRDVRCTYRFVTDRRLYARIILNIHSIDFKVRARVCREHSGTENSNLPRGYLGRWNTLKTEHTQKPSMDATVPLPLDVFASWTLGPHGS